MDFILILGKESVTRRVYKEKRCDMKSHPYTTHKFDKLPTITHHTCSQAKKAFIIGP